MESITNNTAGNETSGVQLSVVICTHNPKDSCLSRVLASLRNQTVPPREWELLIVDNGSSEPVAGRFDIGWHPATRIIREDRLGLTPARLRGIRESTGELLVFVDDDNFLNSDYLDVARRISINYPYLGAWSGQCRPEFEEPPPDWTRPYWGMLVIREFHRDSWSNLPHLHDTMPCGAGLCVRRQVANAYLDLHNNGLRERLLDRRGTVLMSAGDNDLAACACDLGLGVGLFHELILIHKIPRERLTEQYLVRLADGIHYSGVLFRSLRDSPPARRTFLRRAADLIRSYRMPRRERRIFRACCTAECRAIRDLKRDKMSGGETLQRLE